MAKKKEQVIDKSGLIEALTSGIGATLGRSARRSFYTLHDRLVQIDAFKKWKHEERQAAIDILALSVFNSTVIVPLSGSINVVNDSRTYGISRVRMVDYHLDKKHVARTVASTKQFYELLGEFDVSMDELYAPTLREFMKNMKRCFRRWQLKEKARG